MIKIENNNFNPSGAYEWIARGYYTKIFYMAVNSC